MMRQRARKNILLLVAAAVIALACVPTLAPVPTPIPTFDETLLGTYIAETANAAATQTQSFITPSATPTFTETPTRTPSETPTPTVTFVFSVSSATPTVGGGSGGADYACTLLGQVPANNSLVLPGAPFSVRWQIKNTGEYAWDVNNVDYSYKSGTKMHVQPGYDLYKNVATGELLDIIVDMTAPTTPGTYSTTWRIRSGGNEFCPLSLTITVK